MSILFRAAAVAAVALVALSAPPVLSQATGWKKDVSAAGIPGTPAAGRIGSQAFRIERAELRNGILELRQGKDFFADRSVTLFLFAKTKTLDGQSFVVKPGNDFGDPHVHMSWRKSGSDDLPKTDMFMNDYSLRLVFGKRKGNRLPGYLYLSLPDQGKSWVAGSFVADLK